MKDKFLKICLAISAFIILFLFFYIIKLQHWCEEVHLQDVVYENQNMVPDEETAEKIAYILADVHLGFEKDCYYDVTVFFDENRNEWQVVYLKMTSDRNGFFLGGAPVVKIEKNTGIVTHVYHDFG